MKKNKERNNSKNASSKKSRSNNVDDFGNISPGYRNESERIEKIRAEHYEYAAEASERILVSQRLNLFKPDKKWFDKHPDRRYRIRLMSAKELQKFPEAGSMALHLLDDGEIMGIPIHIHKPTPDQKCTETTSRLLFSYNVYLQNTNINEFEAMKKALQEVFKHDQE